MSERCNIRAMAEATYKKQCEYLGADHEKHCVQLLVDAYQSFEDEIERLQRDNEGLRNTIKLQAEGKHADVMGMEEIERLQKRNALLEDVAVAAERANEYMRDLHGLQQGPHYLEKALEKLREVSDE